MAQDYGTIQKLYAFDNSFVTSSTIKDHHQTNYYFINQWTVKRLCDDRLHAQRI